MIDNNLLEDIKERFIAKDFLEIHNVEFLNSITDILNFLNEIPDIKNIRVQFKFINHKCFINGWSVKKFLAIIRRYKEKIW